MERTTTTKKQRIKSTICWWECFFCWIVCQFITSNSNLVCFKTVRHSILFPVLDSSRRSISLYPWNRSSGGVSKPYYFSKSRSMAQLKEHFFSLLTSNNQQWNELETAKQIQKTNNVNNLDAETDSVTSIPIWICLFVNNSHLKSYHIANVRLWNNLSETHWILMSFAFYNGMEILQIDMRWYIWIQSHWIKAVSILLFETQKDHLINIFQKKWNILHLCVTTFFRKLSSFFFNQNYDF